MTKSKISKHTFKYHTQPCPYVKKYINHMSPKSQMDLPNIPKLYIFKSHPQKDYLPKYNTFNSCISVKENISSALII